MVVKQKYKCPYCKDTGVVHDRDKTTGMVLTFICEHCRDSFGKGE